MTTTQEIIRKTNNRAEDVLVRTVTAMVCNRVEPQGAAKFFARRPDDEASPLLMRAVQTAGSVSGSGWASHIAAQAVAAFVLGLGPLSAAAQLFQLAYSANVPEGMNALSVPGVIPSQAGAFVKELDPIPVTSWNFDAAIMTPKKLALITVITRELAKRSGAEAAVRDLLQSSAAITLDNVLFSNAAATDAAPAGLFYGVNATVPGAFDQDSMVNDLTSLASAVSAISGDRLAFVASTARAAQISMRAPNLRYPVLASSAVSDNRVAAVALPGFAVHIGAKPDIEVSQEAILHMSDTPGEIVPDNGAASDPVRSLFQTASLALRVLIEVDWKPRDNRAVAFIEGLSW